MTKHLLHLRAFANANTEFGNVYAFNSKGGIIDAQGARFVVQKQETLNTAMGSYANDLLIAPKLPIKFILGSMTLKEVETIQVKRARLF